MAKAKQAEPIDRDDERKKRGQIWAIRVILCEMFIGWALAVSPDGYLNSMCEAVLLAAENPGRILKSKASRNG